jgi:hypothetical protein
MFIGSLFLSIDRLIKGKAYTEPEASHQRKQVAAARNSLQLGELSAFGLCTSCQGFAAFSELFIDPE